MLPLIALAFVALPLVEIAVLIHVGGAIGAWNTVLLVVLTAVAGTVLVRAQGLATLARVQESLARDVFPAAALFDGACLLAAGMLLLTPGFVTDAIGLLLLLPPVRGALRRLIWRRLRRSGGRIWIDGAEVNGPHGAGRGLTIEGEWREVEPPEERQRRD